MVLEGDHSVIKAIHEKKRLMESGQPHDHIKPLLIIDGGLMKGAYGVGAAIAIDELDYTKVFENYAGVSSGAGTLAYLLSGNTIEGERVIYEDLCSRKFMSLRRFWNMFDPCVFERALRGETGKPLRTANILTYKGQFHIGVAEYETGNPVLLQPDNEEELYLSLRASISMPGITRVKTIVHGVRYSDGASTYPLAVEKMMTDIDATHILFITNQDKHTVKLPLIDTLFNEIFFRHRMPRPLRVAASMRWETRHELVHRTLERPQKPVMIVWGDGSIGSFERDPEKVRPVVQKSKEWWRSLLANPNF